MKTLSVALLLVCLPHASCRRETHVEAFELTRAEILEDVVKHGEEVVEVVGYSGPYKVAFTHYGNYGDNEGGIEWSEGVSRAARWYSMRLLYVEESFYHRIPTRMIMRLVELCL